MIIYNTDSTLTGIPYNKQVLDSGYYNSNLVWENDRLIDLQIGKITGEDTTGKNVIVLGELGTSTPVAGSTYEYKEFLFGTNTQATRDSYFAFDGEIGYSGHWRTVGTNLTSNTIGYYIGQIPFDIYVQSVTIYDILGKVGFISGSINLSTDYPKRSYWSADNKTTFTFETIKNRNSNITIAGVKNETIEDQIARATTYTGTEAMRNKPIRALCCVCNTWKNGVADHGVAEIVINAKVMLSDYNAWKVRNNVTT